MTRIITALCFSITTLLAMASQVEEMVGRIAMEKARIDLFDGMEDQYVRLKSDLQSAQATATYISSVDEIVGSITSDYVMPTNRQVLQLMKVYDILSSVNAKNHHFYTKFSTIFNLIKKVQTIDDASRMESVLKSNVYSALNLIAFYVDNPAASPFLTSAAYTEPAELLKHYDEFAFKKYSMDVLNSAGKIAPMKIKTYLATWNTIHRDITKSTDPVIMRMYQAYKEKGMASRSLVLLNSIVKNGLDVEQAHQIARFDSSLFSFLISVRNQDDLLAEHSVDEALTSLCLKKVRVINDLHNESDAKRFASLRKLSADQIYTLMVYSEDEIYTSTFLGMYNRMMSKMEASSSYEFLHHQNFNMFRTFIKMCAGYNTLNQFVGKMSQYEKEQLFHRLVEGLEKSNDNLSSAVAIADTYGSLSSYENKQLFEQSILGYYYTIQDVNPEGAKLYSLLLSVFEFGGGSYAMDTEDLKVLRSDRIFKDGKNVQQHWFFDDPDGRSSYAHFKSQFSRGNWKISDKGTYILVTSTSGMPVEMYANKPSSEYAGQDAIRAIFEQTQRWPDIVVHRGHSYFVSAAIESLTPAAEIVFLGSCGGYNNINSVLSYSPEAQIISSKQVGTMLVNDRLCFELNEAIRKGEDIVWDQLWSKIDGKFSSGSTAKSRFQDYIPPHKNLGAVLIKTYRNML